MPKITAYIGVSHFCALLYKSKTDYDLFYSPYVYINDVFSNHTNEEDFYTNILELFCKKNDVKLENCEVYISGFIQTLNFKSLNFRKLEFTKLFQNMTTFYPVIVNNYAFATKYFIISKQDNVFVQTENNENSFKLNNFVYPNIKAQDLSSQISLDKDILYNVIKDKLIWNQDLPVVFMDSRFYGEDPRPIDYIYIFSLIDAPGVYDLYIDRGHVLLLFNMLNAATGEQLLPLDLDNIEHAGTLISCHGDVECLISSEDGTNIVLPVDKNSLKRTSLNEEKEYRVVIQNENLGVVEKNVFGGTYGLIVDTRNDKTEMFNNSRRFDAFIRFLKD